MEFFAQWYDQLDSTNSYVKEQFSQGKKIKSGTLVVARKQTAGRGRQNRTWNSSPNTNLCFSLFLETSAELIEATSLTMAVALAITEMLNTQSIPASPKWPNDILVGNKKICGILSERVEYKEEKGIIIGIGLNVNMTNEEAQTIDRPATSMRIETEMIYDLVQTLEGLYIPLAHWIHAWKEGGFKNLREIWTEKSGSIGKPLTIHDGDLKKTGTLAGYGEHGELLLKTPKGIETIWSGDVF